MSECFVCRCEEVTDVEIERALAAGAMTVNDVKRQTRAGMGVCQGAYCVTEIARRIAATRGNDGVAMSPMTARPPVRVITLAALAVGNE